MAITTAPACSTGLPGRPGRTVAPDASRHRWPLAFGAGRVAMWQLAVLAILATGFRINPLTIPMLALAGVVLAATMIQVGGQCAYQWGVILVRYRLRRGATGQPAPTAVHSLAPRLLVQAQVDRAGNSVAVATLGDDADYVAVVQVAPAAHPDPAVLVEALRRAFDREENPLYAARLVVWATPASPRPIRMHWLAVRYRYADAPWAGLARGGGPDGGRRAAASAAQRLVSDLVEAGCPSAALNTPELYRALSVGIGADTGTVNGGSYRVRETWRDWAVGPAPQACFVPRRAADQLSLIGLCVPGARFTCTSYALSRTADGRVTATTAVRVGLSAGQDPGASRQAAATLGVRLLAANGRHGEYALATLPLA